MASKREEKRAFKQLYKYAQTKQSSIGGRIACLLQYNINNFNPSKIARNYSAYVADAACSWGPPRDTPMEAVQALISANEPSAYNLLKEGRNAR